MIMTFFATGAKRSYLSGRRSADLDAGGINTRLISLFDDSANLSVEPGQPHEESSRSVSQTE
jgi:hypothetical protein